MDCQNAVIFQNDVTVAHEVCHVTCTERPQKGSGSDGGGLEVDGEEGEDSVDQEGS